MARSWTANQLSETMRQYQHSCVLLASCELDLFGAIEAGANDAASIAERIGADIRGTTMLLDALAAMEVLSKTSGRYAIAPGVADVLTERGSQSMLAMAQHQANCLRSWADLARTVKTGRPADRGESVRGEKADYAAFIEAMDNVSRITAPGVIGALPPLKFTRLLDVGGASGTWTIEFLKRYPGARATLFDLPVVLPQAEQRLRENGMLDRVDLKGGDFMKDPLPTGADLAWVSAIIHQMSRDEYRGLFRSVAAALSPRGQILIRDHVMRDDRVQPLGGAMFAINMLANTQRGGTFTLNEISEDLRASGFDDPQPLKLDETMNCIISARKRG